MDKSNIEKNCINFTDSIARLMANLKTSNNLIPNSMWPLVMQSWPQTSYPYP